MAVYVVLSVSSFLKVCVALCWLFCLNAHKQTTHCINYIFKVI